MDGRYESKKDFQDLMFQILDPLKAHYSEGKARLDLGVTVTQYDQKAIWMEAISRPLWALVPFWAGGGSDEAFEKIYPKALVSGSDPDSPEYWGKCKPYDQRFVEMAAMAYGLIFTPEKLWDPMTEEEKDVFSDYLYQINEHEIPGCNWVFFNVLVNVALMKHNRKYSQERLDEYLNQVETFYRGKGWYSDGPSNGHQVDYYVSFAIHFYSLVYATVMEQEDPVRCRRYKERAMEFAKTFVYWFDANGAALPFGRSLTYRFSQVSFFSACIMAGIEPFSIAEMKGIIVRHLKYWLELPIFDRDGILTIGYGYPNINMAEQYNAPGSPYWAMKTFAFLMLPDEHPFWRVESESYPEHPSLCSLPEAKMLIKDYGNHTSAFCPGSYGAGGHGHAQAKYGKFVYDTRFGISIPKSQFSLWEASPDSMLAFEIDGLIFVRRLCTEYRIEEDHVVSVWSPFIGIEVETTLIPNEKGHVRIHKIISDRECKAYECGFSISNLDMEKVKEETGDGFVSLENGYSKVEIHAAGQKGQGMVFGAFPNSHLVYQRTKIPALVYEVKVGRTQLESRIIAQWKE